MGTKGAGRAVKQIDIEDLLRWAYVEELPKQGIATTAAGGLAALLAYGTAIDVTHREPEPIAFGEPHPDALRLDYRVRALDAAMFTTAFARHLLGELAPYLMREIVHITKTGMFRKRKGDVAGIVLEERTEQTSEIERREVDPAMLVILHARLGNRPHWNIGAPAFGPVKGKNNQPVIVGITKGHRYGAGAYCPLRLEPSAETIARARFDYAVWWMSLMTLAASCELDEHRILPPRAAAQPWLTGEEAKPIIHRGGQAEIPQHRQRVYVELPPLRTTHGKAKHVPFTTPEEAPC